MAGRLNEAADVRQGDDKDDVDRGLCCNLDWGLAEGMSPDLESPLEFFLLKSLN